MIDKRIAVGRIVFRLYDGDTQWVDPMWVGKITKVSGKQVTFDRRINVGEKTRPTESRLLLDWKVACVCDTEDEVLEVLLANDQVSELHRHFKLGRDGLILSVLGEAK